MVLNDTPLMCRERYIPSRRAMAPPIQERPSKVNRWVKIFLENSIRKRTKRVADNCHLGCTILGNSSLNSWEDIPGRPWNFRSKSWQQSFRLSKGFLELAYLACLFAKPLWAWIEELMPGKRVESSGFKIMLTFVAITSLNICRSKKKKKSCQPFFFKLKLPPKSELTHEKGWILDEQRRPFLAMARSQHTLNHEW